jgi:hypothetical protein
VHVIEYQRSVVCLQAALYKMMTCIWLLFPAVDILRMVKPHMLLAAEISTLFCNFMAKVGQG